MSETHPSYRVPARDHYAEALAGARHNLSEFADLVGDRFNDFLPAGDRPKYPLLATPEKQEPAKAFMEAIWACWKDFENHNVAQTMSERAIGQAVHGWMMDACRQCELNHGD